MEMVERVARAIHAKSYETRDNDRMPDWPEVAKAAIAAMREPTKEMGMKAWGEFGDSSEPERVWRFMIDAALSANGQSGLTEK